MNIGFDIDETLTNSEKYIKDLCLGYIKKNNLPHKMINPNAQSASDMFDWSFEEFCKFWDDYGFVYENFVPAKNESSKVLKDLKNAGHKIFIVTSRFTQNTFERSKNWLTKNNIPFDFLAVNVRDKAQYCLDNNIKLFVDDSLKVYYSLKQSGINVLMIDGYTNREVNDIQKIYSLEEVKKYLD